MAPICHSELALAFDRCWISMTTTNDFFNNTSAQIVQDSDGSIGQLPPDERVLFEPADITFERGLEATRR